MDTVQSPTHTGHPHGRRPTGQHELLRQSLGQGAVQRGRVLAGAEEAHAAAGRGPGAGGGALVHRRHGEGGKGGRVSVALVLAIRQRPKAGGRGVQPTYYKPLLYV
jgi:hypothetical protein